MNYNRSNSALSALSIFYIFMNFVGYKIFGSILLVEFGPVHSRNRSWNSTLGIHKVLRLFYFGEFRPGGIRLNSFLWTEPPAEYICFQTYKKKLGRLVTARFYSLFLLVLWISFLFFIEIFNLIIVTPGKRHS